MAALAVQQAANRNDSDDNRLQGAPLVCGTAGAAENTTCGGTSVTEMMPGALSYCPTKVLATSLHYLTVAALSRAARSPGMPAVDISSFGSQ